jgi:hypothetical protein
MPFAVCHKAQKQSSRQFFNNPMRRFSAILSLPWHLPQQNEVGRADFGVDLEPRDRDGS